MHLYQGDIKGAVERFRAAGPYTSDRVEATWRTTLLALLQTFETDSNPKLGHALLLLEQGDTAQASSALEQLASALPPQHGGAELNLLAGRLLFSMGALPTLSGCSGPRPRRRRREPPPLRSWRWPSC